MLIVKETIKCSTKPNIIYATAFEEVTQVSDMGEILILKNKDGNTFPCKKSLVDNVNFIPNKPKEEKKKQTNEKISFEGKIKKKDMGGDTKSSNQISIF